MALIKCPECGKELSEQSKRCPHCGYPIKKPFFKRHLRKIIIVVAIVFAMAVISGGVMIAVSLNNTMVANNEQKAYEQEQKICENDTKVKYGDKTISLGCSVKDILDICGTPDETNNLTVAQMEKNYNSVSFIDYPDWFFMFEDNVLKSIFIENNKTKTWRGFGIENSTEDFIKLYKNKDCVGNVEITDEYTQYSFSYNGQAYNIRTAVDSDPSRGRKIRIWYDGFY